MGEDRKPGSVPSFPLVFPLAEKHTRPVLAKIYRAYISEVVAVMKGASKISEIYIEGDGVWGVFNTTIKPDVDAVISTAAEISSLIDILNIKLTKKKYSAISVGIGIGAITRDTSRISCC